MEPGPVHARPASQSHVQASERELMKLGETVFGGNLSTSRAMKPLQLLLDGIVEMAVLRQSI